MKVKISRFMPFEKSYLENETPHLTTFGKLRLRWVRLSNPFCYGNFRFRQR